MPAIAWLFIGLLVLWTVVVAVIVTWAVKAGKLQLKRGGAPRIDGSSGPDSSTQL